MTIATGSWREWKKREIHKINLALNDTTLLLYSFYQYILLIKTYCFSKSNRNSQILLEVCSSVSARNVLLNFPHLTYRTSPAPKKGKTIFLNTYKYFARAKFNLEMKIQDKMNFFFFHLLQLEIGSPLVRNHMLFSSINSNLQVTKLRNVEM